MRFGLIADIHEHVEFLRVALHRFRQERVDQIVVLGDMFETGERIEETCRLLAEAYAE
jgi:predicted phosphodiesterase